MGDLKEWIEAQLKRGYTKSQIKKVLIKKGYPLKAVAEVDRVTYSALPSKKIHGKFLSKPFVLIVLFIGIVFVVWSFGWLPFSLQQESKDGVSVAEVSSGNLCDGFKETEYTVSCDEAVTLALDNKPGEILKISLGIRRGPTYRDEKLLQEEMLMWLFDVKLSEPFYDDILDIEYKQMRVGIGTEDNSFIYWEEIE